MNIDAGEGLRAVARFADGRVLKGTTHDFGPAKTKFHMTPRDGSAAKPVAIQIGDLKALFFVRSFEGDAKHVDDNSFERAAGQGRRVIVTFKDGETLAGFTMGYAPDKPGFFVIPADRGSNNARVFVVSGAVAKLDWVAASNPAFAAAGGSRA